MIHPFTYEKGAPPFHLRPYTPAELEQHRRMVAAQERLRYASSASRRKEAETLISNP